jgi:hypothetical protein
MHKENGSASWLHDYFFPYIRAYAHYDKKARYYHDFGHNLRMVETNNVSSDDVQRTILCIFRLKLA